MELSYSNRLGRSRLRFLIILCFVALIILLLVSTSHVLSEKIKFAKVSNSFKGPFQRLPVKFERTKDSTLASWKPPKEVRVVALVFFGRRENISILDCYLKKNLKVNGGVLDEVIFAVWTDNAADLEYLDHLVQNPHYRKHVAEGQYEGFAGAWESVNESDTIYVKIDDDVVYVEDTAFKAVAKRLIDNPQLFAASANVINNPALAWVHYHMGVYKPFWPELEKQSTVSKSWRPSTLPDYTGPLTGPQGFDGGGDTPAPYKGHRWLPVRNSTYDISLTPASTLTYDGWGPSLNNWAAVAQTHYSFLSHLEEGKEGLYHFDHWDYMYERVSINFVGFRGKDLMDVFPIPQGDDETYLTTIRPKELGRHVVVDGRGIVVHFSFGPQEHAHEDRGIGWTDIKDRYQGYAAENGCD